MNIPELSPGMREIMATCHGLASERNLAGLRELLADKATSFSHDDSDCSDVLGVALIMAVQQHDVESIQALLDIGARVDGDEYRDLGFPPLYFSITGRPGNSDVIRLLLSRGANPNIRMVNDELPLHVAIQHDDYEVVEALLEFGADPNLTTRIDSYYSPLMKASALGRLEIMDLLLKAGADPSYKNLSGESAEMVAARRSREKVKQLLAAVYPKKSKSPRKRGNH